MELDGLFIWAIQSTSRWIELLSVLAPEKVRNWMQGSSDSSSSSSMLGWALSSFGSDTVVIEELVYVNT